MSLPDDVLRVLRAAGEPLANKEVREHLDDAALTSEKVGTAIGALLKRGVIEPVDIPGQKWPSYVLATGPASTAVQSKRAAPPKPAAASPAEGSGSAPQPQATPARVTRIECSDFSRRLMREAAMLLLDAAGEAPMSPRAARVIAELIGAAA